MGWIASLSGMTPAGCLVAATGLARADDRPLVVKGWKVLVNPATKP